MIVTMEGKYKTKGGYEVVIDAVDRGGEWPVHGAISDYSGDWVQRCWASNGRESTGVRNGMFDLVEIKPRIKATGWANLYPVRRGSHIIGGLFSTKDWANEEAADNRIACIPISIDCEEGEGL